MQKWIAMINHGYERCQDCLKPWFYTWWVDSDSHFSIECIYCGKKEVLLIEESELSKIITPGMVFPLARTWFGRGGQGGEGIRIHFMILRAFQRILFNTFAKLTVMNDDFLSGCPMHHS